MTAFEGSLQIDIFQPNEERDLAFSTIFTLASKLFGEQIIIINIFTIIIYLLSVFLISLTIKNLTNEFYALIATVLILFNHPIPWLPWPNYLAFFLLDYD